MIGLLVGMLFFVFGSAFLFGMEGWWVMAKISKWLVMVEHAHSRKRQQLYRYFERNGVAFSGKTYLLELAKKDVERVLRDVKRITGGEGRVSLVPVCSACRRRAILIGNNQGDFEVSPVIIIT